MFTSRKKCNEMNECLRKQQKHRANFIEICPSNIYENNKSIEQTL